MDGIRGKSESNEDGTARSVRLRKFRGFFSGGFCFVASCFVSFLLGMFVLLVWGSSGLRSSVSVASQCRIIASDVDLRSSKICELSMSNCKAKYNHFPSGKTKILCYEDYYWASIFKVEYKEYFSGKMIYGVTESPKEALPIYCRPNFNLAWRTKSKFKVNETYHCRYSLGTFKADVYPDHLFNCQAGNPSATEMMIRSFTLFLSCLKTLSWDTLHGWHHVLAVATGSVGGVVSSMLAVGAAHIIQAAWPEFSKKLHPIMQHIYILAMRLRRPLILIAYTMITIWFVIQYIHTIGLKQPLVDSLARAAMVKPRDTDELVRKYNQFL